MPLALGTTLAVGAVTILGLAANWFAAALLAFTILFYVFVYTMWLKRRTPENIVIGGAAGALPPVIGWAAVTGTVDPGSLVLFLIIFLWTPPHSWALALFTNSDYAEAGVPMLPVAAGIPETKRQIVIYSVSAGARRGDARHSSASPDRSTASWRRSSALVFVALALETARMRADDAAMAPARRLFAFSLLYLFLLFAMLLAGAGLGVAGLAA